MFPPFDPSKLDPKTLMELTNLIRQLPPDQIQKMQTLMHNMMAGFDVKKEMEEFEKSLPAGFREKLLALMLADRASATPSPAVAPAEASDMNVREARLTILRAVQSGQMTPEEAEKLLFQE